eukprot:131930_1
MYFDNTQSNATYLTMDTERDHAISNIISIKDSSADILLLLNQYKEYVTELQEWVQSQENIDLYQMVAFYSGSHDKKNFALHSLKIVCVFFIQTAGMIVLTKTQWEKADKNHVCNRHDFDENWNVYLAFFFSLLISLLLNDQLSAISKFGMYDWAMNESDNLPPFINRLWLGIGLSVNVFVLGMSWFTSVIIIYLSDDPIDMVLNSMAVYFIIELDDEVVGWSNYEHIEIFLEQKYESWMEKCKLRAERNNFRESWSTYLGKFVLFMLKWITYPSFRLIVFILSFAPPLYVLICY